MLLLFFVFTVCRFVTSDLASSTKSCQMDVDIHEKCEGRIQYRDGTKLDMNLLNFINKQEQDKCKKREGKYLNKIYAQV